MSASQELGVAYKPRTQTSITTDDDWNSHLSNDSGSSVCSCMNRILCYAGVGVLIVAGIAAGIAVWTGASRPSEFFVQEDPPGRNETLLWPVAFSETNEGLELVIENALVDSWTPYLEHWVQRWDAGYGTVDPLSLSIQRVAVDAECTPSDGRIKVCNGDYGRTDWRGINVALTQGDFIVHSVAKLNDYWLYEEDQKQYTMCHELGHGFGLAHTDEIYTNINTGECMDYTNRPGRNLDPGVFNFDLLASIYGSIRAGVSAPTTTTPEWTGQQSDIGESDSSNSWNGNKNDDEEKEDHENRWLRRRMTTVQLPVDVSDSIMEQYHRAVMQIEQMTCIDCLVDLTDGYRVEVHRLLAF